MSLLRLAIRLAVLAVIVGLAWFFGPRAIAALQKPPRIAVVSAVQQHADRLLAVTGRVRARLRNDLAPVVRGRITALTKAEGEPVRCDEVLARLDDSTLEAELAEATARREEADDRLAQARRDLERAVELQQTGIAADGALEDTQLAVQVARRGVKAAESRVTALTTRREDLLLRSRFDGVVLERPVDPGQIVGPGDIVYSVATIDDPLVEAEIDERFLDALAIGQYAAVATISDPETIYEAQLEYIGRSIDRLSGAVIVRFRFRESPQGLAIGCTLDVNVRVAEHPQAIVVPRAAIVDLEGAPWVYVVESTTRPDEHRLERRPIEAIDWPSDRIIVRSGLQAGEVIALAPRGLPDSSVVRIEQGSTPR